MTAPTDPAVGLLLGGSTPGGAAGPAPDRASDRRRDADWVAARWAEPGTRVLTVADGRLRLADDGRPQWSTSDSSDPVASGRSVLLGRHRGRWHFARLLDAPPPGDDDEAWVPLRSALTGLAGVLGQDGGAAEMALVFHAVGIAQWQLVTRHCPRDGSLLDPAAAGHELRCRAHGHAQFPRSDPAVIMLITDGEPGTEQERCLLGRSPAWPPGRYSTLAGFVEPGETLEDAVRREVSEETGVVVGDVTYVGSQPWPLPASLMLGFRGRATSTEIHVDELEIEDARWLTRAQLRAGIDTGELVFPGGLSISHALIEGWYGEPLPGRW